LRSNLSVKSGNSKGKKRRMTCTTPDLPKDLVFELRTAMAADISAQMIRRVEEIMRVPTTSSNLKGTEVVMGAKSK
jgi:hypothetical protein